jgi:hypothetical protein
VGGSTNFINTMDRGRYIQGSFYGADGAGTWLGMPWAWNPVQLGSYDNQPARVERVEAQGANKVQVEMTPRDWSTGRLLEDTRFYQEVRWRGLAPPTQPGGPHPPAMRRRRCNHQARGRVDLVCR